MAKSTSSYDDNVFINCPFDKPYKPIFNAIVFAIHDAGFIACCGLEAIDSGQTRLTKLISIIKECKYGIHDISRTEVGGRTNLPRFNMPFECGLFWGCFDYGAGKQKNKRTPARASRGSELTGLQIPPPRRTLLSFFKDTCDLYSVDAFFTAAYNKTQSLF